MKKLMASIIMVFLWCGFGWCDDLYEYAKAYDKDTSYDLQGTSGCKVTEICRVDGKTFVLVDGVLPKQKDTIKNSIVKSPTITPELRQKIIANSPTIQLTLKRMTGEEPETRYSEEDGILLKKLVSFFDEDKLLAHIKKGRAWDKRGDIKK